MEDAVLHKLDEARQLLLATPASQPERLTAQLQLTRELMHTLNTLPAQ